MHPAPGLSLPHIAKSSGIANSTAITRNRKLDWGIEAAKNVPVDALLGGLGVGNEERLKALGAMTKILKQKLLASAEGKIFYDNRDYFIKINQLFNKEERDRSSEKGFSPVKVSLAQGKRFEALKNVYYVVREMGEQLVKLFGPNNEEYDLAVTELEKDLDEHFEPGEIDEVAITLSEEALKWYQIDAELVQFRPAKLVFHSGMK